MSKRNHCIFCGSHMPKRSIVRGIHVQDTCVEPTCPHYGTESGSEYENLDGFSIIDLDEVDDGDF